MSRSKKSTEPVEATVIEPVTASAPGTPQKKKRTSSIFWGFAFIFIGVLLLLDNLNVVTVHFGNLWQLWPVFLVGAGVSMLSLRGWLSSLISLVLALAFGVLAYLVAVENPFYASSSQLQHVETLGGTVSDQAKILDVTLKTGAMDIRLGKMSGEGAYKASLSSTHMSLQKEQDFMQDDVQHVALVTGSQKRWWLGPMSNSLQLDFTNKLPLDITIDAGASSVTGDLSALQVRNFTLDAGASSVELKFGAAQTRLSVNLDAGASSVKLSLPASVGVRVETDNGLSHTDFAGIDKVSDGVYESSGFASAERQIIIRADIGVSSFEITRY